VPFFPRPYFRDSFTGNSKGNSSSPAGTRSLAMPVSTPSTRPPVAAFQRPDRTPPCESSTGSSSRFGRPACSRNFSFRPFARGFPPTVSSYAASTNLRSKASGFFSSRSAFSVDVPTPRLSICVSFTATKRLSVIFIDSVSFTASRGMLPDQRTGRGFPFPESSPPRDQPTAVRFALASTSGPTVENGISKRTEQPPSGCGATVPSTGMPPDPKTEKLPFSRSPHGAAEPAKTSSIPVFVSAIGPTRSSRTEGTGAAAGGAAESRAEVARKANAARIISPSLRAFRKLPAK
jgi:hypothetical protein